MNATPQPFSTLIRSTHHQTQPAVTTPTPQAFATPRPVSQPAIATQTTTATAAKSSTTPPQLAPGICAYRHKDTPVPAGHEDRGAPSATSNKRLYCRPYAKYVPKPTATPHDYKDGPEHRTLAVPRGTTITTHDGWELTVLDVEWHYEAVVAQAYPNLVRQLGLLPGEQAIAVKLRVQAPQPQGYSIGAQLYGFELATDQTRRLISLSPHMIQAWHPRDLAERGLVEQLPKLAGYRTLLYNFRSGETDDGWIVFNVPSTEVADVVLRRWDTGPSYDWWKLEV